MFEHIPTPWRSQPTGFERLVMEHDTVEARKKRNIASKRHQKHKKESEKHQQQVYEYIKEGARRSQEERLPLAMEAKIAQFNAVVARVRSFKGLKNQLIWRMVEVRNNMPDPDSFSDDDVDVSLSNMQGEMGQITSEFRNWNSAIQSELSELMNVLDAFDFEGGALEVEADDMLQKMENFDDETSPDELVDGVGIDISKQSTSMAGTVSSSSVSTDGGEVNSNPDIGGEVDGAVDIESALDQMENVADRMDD